MTASGTRARTGRRGGRRLRQLLVFLHVTSSLGWMGAGAANLVLAVTGATTGSAEVRRVSYALIDQIDVYLVIPLAFTTLIGGIVVSLATPWGLIRHWWVLAKLVLTLAVIVFSTFGVGVWVYESIDASADGGTSPVALRLVQGAGANIVAFLFMSFVSFAKPWGTTPWTRTRRRRTTVVQPGL
ncbi:MAG TPA: hypothetical protein VIT20_10820 [Propionibacteriaceae bacterium]